MKIRPLHDRVIVKRVEPETRDCFRASTSRMQLVKSRIRALYWRLVPANVTIPASSSRWMSKPVTKFFSANIPARTSRLTAKNIS